MINTSQQVGGSIGTALLSTLFASATAAYLASHTSTRGLNAAAAIHGYTVAFSWAAGIFALGLILTLLILPSKARRSPSTPKIARSDATGTAARAAAPKPLSS
jgi:hypothetical protein